MAWWAAFLMHTAKGQTLDRDECPEYESRPSPPSRWVLVLVVEVVSGRLW